MSKLRLTGGGGTISGTPSEKKAWKLINFCEFDKYAVKSYCAIHNVDESLNIGDITKVDEGKLEHFNMICGGSPCQDFSIAGEQRGSVWTCKECGREYNPLTVHWSKRDKCPHCESINIEKTRSSLLVEYLRIVKANSPNFGIYENVKNIVGKKFRETTFKLFEEELHEYGYNTYWEILNAKDFGVPQNRERVYLIFIKKEIDNGNFVFPKGFYNDILLKDLLDDDVDKKYYLSQEVQRRFQITDNTFTKNIIGTTKPEFRTIGQRDLVYQKESVIGALVATDYKQPKQILVNDYDSNNYAIRKITPKECFRLMGFSDNDFDACKDLVSDTQLYKQAGNSIVVDVLYYILVELYTAMPYLFDDLRLSSFFSGIGAFEIALNKLYIDINNEGE